MKEDVCKICRRRGQKLFLKGEKCFSPHCPMVRKPYPPGQRTKNRRHSVSNYGENLAEKQKLKNYYNLRENQFQKYVGEILKSRHKSKNAALALIRQLESRLDNVVFRLGFASSRKQARQLVSYGWFLVDSKAVNIPSFRTKKSQIISIKENKKRKPFFKELSVNLKSYKPPAWLKVDKKNVNGEILKEPLMEDIGVAVSISSIFEFYSR